MVKSISVIGIGQPIEYVFEYLQSASNYPLWQSGITNYAATEGMSLGSLLTYTRSGDMGDQVTATLRVTMNNGIDSMESRSVSGPMSFRNEFRLEKVSPTYTRFHVVVEADVPALPRQSEVALQYLTDARLGADLKKLKALLEASGPRQGRML